MFCILSCAIEAPPLKLPPKLLPAELRGVVFPLNPLGCACVIGLLPPDGARTPRLLFPAASGFLTLNEARLPADEIVVRFRMFGAGRIIPTRRGLV